jgi:hypothetical protein
LISEHGSRSEQKFTKEPSTIKKMIVLSYSSPNLDDALFLQAVDTHIEDGSLPFAWTPVIDDKTSITHTGSGIRGARFKGDEFFYWHTRSMHAFNQLLSQLFV